MASEARHCVSMDDRVADETRHRGGPALFVDADACPVLSAAIGIATARRVRITLVANHTQNLGRFASRAGVEIFEVPGGSDAADFWIASHVEAADVVVTGDIGLAAMVLGRGARALGFRGQEFHSATIDAALLVRHEEKKVRRGGGRTKGPAPLTDEDKERFAAALKRMLGAPPLRPGPS